MPNSDPFIVVIAGTYHEYVAWFRDNGYWGHPLLSAWDQGVIYPSIPAKLLGLDWRRMRVVFVGTWYTNQTVLTYFTTRLPWMVIPTTFA